MDGQEAFLASLCFLAPFLPIFGQKVQKAKYTWLTSFKTGADLFWDFFSFFGGAFFFFLVCGLCACFLSSSCGVVGWCFCGGVVVFLWWCFCGGVVVFWWCFCCGVLVVFLWWCLSAVLVVVFLLWCFCCGVFVVVFLWWCFCGGVVVFLWWCGGDFVAVWWCFCVGVMVFLCWCVGACYGAYSKKKAGGGLGGRAQRLPPMHSLQGMHCRC